MFHFLSRHALERTGWRGSVELPLDLLRKSPLLLEELVQLRVR
jgi:hypothetical protein